MKNGLDPNKTPGRGWIGVPWQTLQIKIKRSTNQTLSINKDPKISEVNKN
jgi:hypothetical protein